MPASLIAAALFESAFAVAAATFVIRVVMAIAISKLLAKNVADQQAGQTSTPGTEIQLGPNTDNKVPVVYGNRFTPGIVTDAIISHDQTTMWYVVTFAEKTGGTTNFGHVYYDGKLLIFDPDNPSEITGWYTQPKRHSKVGGHYNTKPAGKVSMWFYPNGSLSTGATHYCYTMTSTAEDADIDTVVTGTTDTDAITLLQNSAIDSSQQWTSSDTMKGATFAIIKLVYDQNAGIYGLGQIDLEIQNSLHNPGDVFLDYFTNTNYGCGIPIENVNTASLAFLNSLSVEPITIYDTDGNLVTSSYTYSIDGILDTAQDCLTNLNNLSDACDSWVQWDEKLGQWGIIPNISLEQAGGSTATMTVINSDQIIGGVNLVPTDLKSSANQITIAFPNIDLYNQTDYRYYWLDSQFMSPNEPVNNIDINMPFVTSSTQATILGYRKLWMGREDIAINFSMDYSGIHLNAGDIFALQHEWYGWEPGEYNGVYFPGKPFRATQVKESKDSSGFLSVEISAIAYNDSIYYTTNPHFFTPDTFGLAVETNDISTPIPPYASAGILYATSPAHGNVSAMEFWISTSTQTADYQLLQTVSPGDGTLYSSGTVVTYDLKTLPTYTGYAISRAQGPHTVSNFSTPYAFTWVNEALNGNANTANTATDAINVNTNHTVSATDFYLNMINSANAGGYVGVEYNSGVVYSANNSTLTSPALSSTTASHTTLNIASVANLTPLAAAPAGYVTGTVALANNAVGGWDPVPIHANTGTPYLALYNGSAWVKLG
jgi:hypothetical protein